MHPPIIDTAGTFSVRPVLLHAMVSPPKSRNLFVRFSTFWHCEHLNYNVALAYLKGLSEPSIIEWDTTIFSRTSKTSVTRDLGKVTCKTQ